jgi:hypothetical protein
MVMAQFKVVSRNLTKQIEKIYKPLSHNTRSPDRDLNPGSPKYDVVVVVVLTTRSRCSLQRPTDMRGGILKYFAKLRVD